MNRNNPAAHACWLLAMAAAGCLPRCYYNSTLIPSSLLGTETLTVCDFGCGWIVLCLCQDEKSAKYRVKRKSFLDRKKRAGGSGPVGTHLSESDPIPSPEAGKGTFPVNIPAGWKIKMNLNCERVSDIRHEPAPASAYTKEQKTTYDKGLKNKNFCH